MKKRRSCFRLLTLCQTASEATGKPVLHAVVADCKGNVTRVRANASNPNALLSAGLPRASFLKARKLMRKAVGKLSRVPKCQVRVGK